MAQGAKDLASKPRRPRKNLRLGIGLVMAPSVLASAAELTALASGSPLFTRATE
jgi:hypothetical protein